MTFDEWLIARLRARSFYTAASDGSYGRSVINGLKAFQQANNLPVTGTATQRTCEELRKDPGSTITLFGAVPPVPAEPVWMREARRLVGLKEVLGPKSNPTIIAWAQRLGGWMAGFYKDDATPWCGLFMAHVIGATLPTETLPSNPLGALNWATFGRSLASPALGALLVFKRTGGGHITLYQGENDTHYRCLGGNQSDSVSDNDWIAKDRLFAMRWPVTGEAPVGGRVVLGSTGSVSKNEA